VKIWECKIGEVEDLPDGADSVMREAVERAYLRLTGRPAAFAFTGWGGTLSESERAEVENAGPADG